MHIDSCFELGHVIKIHGINGEVDVYIDADDPSRYKKLESVFVEIRQRLVPFSLEKVLIRGNKAILKFAGIHSIEQAEKLTSCRLFLPLENLPALGKNHFYFHEVIGYTVVDTNSGPLGQVKLIYTGGGNNLLAMDYKGKEVLIPLQRQLIRKLDKTNKEIHMDVPDGLLDIYLNP